MNRVLDFALAYARHGWPVFPLCERGKVPLAGSRGVHDATCDEAQVVAWWGRQPQLNIGCSPAGVPCLVLDIDPRHGGSRDGLDLPHTPTVLSGGGGWHLYFQPVAFRPRATAGPGLDVRAGWNPATLPPSVHASGAVYRWEVRPTVPLAPAPAWLLERITPPPPAPVKPVRTRGLEDTYQRAMQYLAAVPGVGEGERDRKVYGLARRLLDLFPTIGPDGTAHLLVTWDATRNSPPLGERIVRQKVASAARAPRMAT